MNSDRQELQRLGLALSVLCGAFAGVAALINGGLGRLEYITGLHENLFFVSSLVGVFVIFLSRETRFQARIAVLGSVLVVTAVALLSMHDGSSPVSILAGSFTLAGSLAFALSARCAYLDSQKRWALFLDVIVAIMLIGFVIVSPIYLNLTTLVRPTIFDLNAYLVDETFGTQIAFLLGGWFRLLPPLAGICGLVYMTTPTALATVYALRTRSGGPASDAILAFCVAGFVGFSIYFVIPIIGPEPLVGTLFPWHPPTPAEMESIIRLGPPPAERNCFPSLHTVWALLIYWHARPLAKVPRRIAFFFFLFTVWATLGFGYHYVYDLLVAFPFALAIYAGTSSRCRGARKAVYVLFGTLGFLGWVGLGFSFRVVLETHVVVPWTLSILTIVITMVAQTRADSENVRDSSSSRGVAV